MEKACSGFSLRRKTCLPALFLVLYLSAVPAGADTASSRKNPDQFPGWIAETWEHPPMDLFQTPWKYRSVTYEILFTDSKKLAASIFGLAKSAADVPPDMDRQRFIDSVQGFHYSIPQVLKWANGNMDDVTEDEIGFIDKLVSAGVILRENGRFWPGSVIKHVLGAAPGRERTLDLNLIHERIHIYWDENLAFKAKSLAKWEALSPEEKMGIIDGLKGYDQSDEINLIEEWTVRQNEQSFLESIQTDEFIFTY